MNSDLKSYLKIYSGWVDGDTCKNLVDDFENLQWEKHSYFNSKRNESETFNTDFYVTCQASKLQSKIHEKIWKAIEQYVVKDFNFPWCNGWNGFTSVRYNKYEIGTEMRIHCDHIQSMFDGERKGVPILTVLGGLNNDYEGGELVMWENEIIELKAGDIMVFPSNFLYPHKVTPVTKGTRYSYVSWVW